MSHGDGVQLLLFCPQLGHLSSDSFLVGCVGFVVSRCVPKEHPATLLARGHCVSCILCLTVILEQQANILEEIYGFHLPPLVAVLGPSHTLGFVETDLLTSFILIDK